MNIPKKNVPAAFFAAFQTFDSREMDPFVVGARGSDV